MVAYPPVFVEQASALVTLPYAMQTRPILRQRFSVIGYRLGQNDVRWWSISL
jgi:hypothetical protein